MPIEDALFKMLESVTPITTTLSLSLPDALGYVLAEEITSPIFVPPFDNSAMDGYAVRLVDLSNTDTLPVAGKSFAGQPFEGDWPQGTCIRIMTGAKIPQDCDAVIMQEQTKVTENGVQFLADKIKPNQNIRPTGDDIQQGAQVLPKGARLTPRDIPMIASLGIAEVTVYRKPKVAFFSTGDELCSLGEPLGAGDIYDSNRYGIAALIENFGCEPLDLGIILIALKR
ncbi:molybdopterin biosynthesis protein MoeA [Vibrio astriarenae]|nr:molybdopterin biosynthesis protein MoeA [Vibrio sp. C7]